MLSPLGVLNVLLSTPPRPSSRKPHWALRLAALAAKPGEICGLAAVLILAALPLVAEAAEHAPVGLLAASSADVVVIGDPRTGGSVVVPTGPVAWLFPAPAGVLFAPDLVHGSTAVIDLRSLAAQDPIAGVTMPRFGTMTDRYLVVADQLLLMSYPDRALMNQYDIGFESPWQVEIAADNSVLLVLERLPDGGGDARMIAVELGEGRLVYRRPLSGDVRHFALSVAFATMALADAGGERVVFVEPATLTPRGEFAVAGKPIDIAFAGDGTFLVLAVERSDGGGELITWKLKLSKKEGLQRKKEWSMSLTAAPLRMALSPDGRHVAVGLENGELQVVDVVNQLMGVTIKLPEAPRDVVWCDPSADGPLQPDWSDDDAPTLDFGPKAEF
jgi:hypothetical protein